MSKKFKEKDLIYSPVCGLCQVVSLIGNNKFIAMTFKHQHIVNSNFYKFRPATDKQIKLYLEDELKNKLVENYRNSI